MLRFFKQNRRLAIKPHLRFHRSPHLTGYHFAFFLIAASLILATCSMNRTLAVSFVRSLTPQSEIPATATHQPDLSTTTVPATISLPAELLTPSESHAATPVNSVLVLSSPFVSRTPTATEAAATSTPGVLATSDLLFISDNRLLRWDHITHYSSSLAENVVAFSTNASGSKIALLRPRGVAANGNELFDLDILDFSSKQARHLIEGTPRLLDLALSPDGARLAFQQNQDGKPAISLLRLSDPASPVNLGECAVQAASSGCTPLAWSSDSQSLVWGDRRGLWIVLSGKGTATQLHNSTVEVPDPTGKASQIEAQFSSPQWSPAGRFVLVQVIPNQSNASWHAVIDSLTGRIGQVLDSYKISPEQVSVSWLPNGKLAVARASDQALQTPATIQVWDVLATNPALLVSAELYKFPSGDFSSGAASLTVTSEGINPLRLDWIQQSSRGHLMFGATQPDTISPVGLYDLNLLTNTVIQLAQLTSGVDKVLWAPDDSGMLVITLDGQVLFFTPDGKETIDLKSTVGSDPKGFIWLPPSLRK